MASFATAQVYKSVTTRKTVPSVTTTAKVYPTSVWATQILPNGQTNIFLSQYNPTFSAFYSTIAKPSSGSIGLGTIKGTVGTVKPKSYTTISLNTKN